MTTHLVATQEDTLAARRELLIAEKEAVRTIEAIAERRRALPWVRVEKGYAFDSEAGTKRLDELFGEHSQLIVYHFMFGPGWKEGCLGCSFVSDHFDGANLHLAHHDVSLVAVSRAKLEEFSPFKRRMGWRFPWVSSHGSDFNYDFGVSFTAEQISAGPVLYNYQKTQEVMEEMQGLSVFTKDGSGQVYHTYSTYARGLDPLLGAHTLLDMTPKGRNEQGVMNWVRHHDKYGVTDAARFPTAEVPPEDCCTKEEAV